ncbi:MAG: hypothetical protein HWE37_09115 [Rhodobacteraceae bacterium]|nr:hypothetical protein [Paracoccaceae bacterium]
MTPPPAAPSGTAARLSLRRRLFRELLPPLFLLWLVGSGFILMRSWDEIGDSYIDQLEHLAFTLAQVLDETAMTAEEAVESVRARRDRNFFVIVLREGQPVLRSALAPEGMVAMPGDGFETRRYYLASAEARDGTVQVITGLKKEEVRQLTTAVVGGAALPMALVMIGMWAVMYVGVGRALAPVERLRAQLAARSPGALGPVGTEGVPEDLQPLVRALDDLLSRLRDAIASERDFVADASHELRTPLAAIRAQVETIDRAALDAPSREALDQVLRGVDRSTRLAQQLLRLARADRLDRPDAPETCLHEALASVVSELFPAAVRQDTELELAADPVMLRIRPEDLGMLVGNLVENALHHGGPGGQVRVSCGSEGGVAWLRVEDAGPGIPEAERARLFARFRRGDGARAHGAGLGLSIVDSVAGRMGATVTLGRSADLGGLSAELRFPPETTV